MTVKIVTDSSSDLPKDLAEKLGIAVVPLYVRFGTDSYRDGVDITPDEFYKKLTGDSVIPVTSAPSPGLFTELYESLAGTTDSIISIHVSRNLSGTYEAAQAGGREVKAKCRIDIIDSRQVTMALGLLAIVAAKAAAAGATAEEIIKEVNDAMPRVYLAGLLNTLEFLEKGGRIGRAEAWMGAMLDIKPILSVQDGEVVPLERVRTRVRAIERLHELLEEHLPASEIGIIHSTTPDEARKLSERVGKIQPGKEVYLARFGPVLGTYVGPGAVGIVTLK